MIGRAVLAILWIRLLGAAGQAQPAGVPLGTWLQDGVKWSKAPREINPKLSAGRAAIINLGLDHAFVLIYTTGNRVPNQYEVICNGCGQVVYRGSWDIENGSIKVKYRLVSRTVLITGEELPGPMQEETGEITGHTLTLLQKTFHRAPGLDGSVREFVGPSASK